MPRNRKTVGAAGEAAAAAYLEAQDYRIIDLNVRPYGGRRRGEIDIVAWWEETLVFVEVKTRRSLFGPHGTPAEAITRAKRRQLLRLAAAYLSRFRLDDVPCRFDVIEAVETTEGGFQFHHLLNAFDGSEGMG